MKLYVVIYQAGKYTEDVLGVFSTKQKAEKAKLVIDGDKTKLARVVSCIVDEARALSKSDKKRLEMLGIKAATHKEYEYELAFSEIDGCTRAVKNIKI